MHRPSFSDPLAQGPWPRVSSPGSLAQGLWPRVPGTGSLAQGHWHRVPGPWYSWPGFDIQIPHYFTLGTSRVLWISCPSPSLGSLARALWHRPTGPGPLAQALWPRPPSTLAKTSWPSAPVLLVQNDDGQMVRKTDGRINILPKSVTVRLIDLEWLVRD